MRRILSSLNRPLSGYVSLVTLPVLLGAIVAVLFIAAQVKSYVEGPANAFATIYRPKPVPVTAETVKWLKGDVRIQRETVKVPVEVIREVPAKVEKHLSDGFKIDLKELHAEHKELLDVLDVPKAPHGGELAVTVDSDSGKIAGTFSAKPAPLIEFGGLREIAATYDPIHRTPGVAYSQDLLRVGPVVLGGRAFVAAPKAGGANYGVELTAGVRF